MTGSLVNRTNEHIRSPSPLESVVERLAPVCVSVLVVPRIDPPGVSFVSPLCQCDFL